MNIFNTPLLVHQAREKNMSSTRRAAVLCSKPDKTNEQHNRLVTTEQWLLPLVAVTEAFEVDAFGISFFFPVFFLRLLEPLSLVFALLLAGLFVGFFSEVLGFGGVFGLICLKSSSLL